MLVKIEKKTGYPFPNYNIGIKEYGDAIPVSIPEFMASIVWSSLLSKQIGKSIREQPRLR